MEKSATRKNYIWNSVGTAVFAFNSLFYMIIVTRINGVSDAGVFSLSFASACIVNAIAIFCGRTYQITDNNEEISEASFISVRLITCLGGLLIAAVFVMITGYDAKKTVVFMLLCTLKCVEAFSDVYYGIIQKRDKLYIAGKSMTYKSLIGVTGFLVVDLLTDSMIAASIFLVIINFIFLSAYDMKYARRETNCRIHFKKNEIFMLFRKASHTFLFTLILLVITNLPRYLIDWRLDSEAQAVYGIISMSSTFMLLLGQFILQPCLVGLAENFSSRRIKEFRRTINYLVGILVGLLIVIIPAAYILGIPVLNLIYNVNLSEYRAALLIVLTGAALYAASSVYLNALITMRCTKVQLYMQVVMLCISVACGYVFVELWGVMGSFIAYAVILMLQFIAYFILYQLMLKKSFQD